MDDEDNKEPLEMGYKYYVQHHNNRPYSYLLVPLEPDCYPFLNSLYLNNYEISDWEEFYLKLWSSDTSKDYVHSGTLLANLGVVEYPIFRNYFRPFCNKVSITTFIEFVCIFSFFTNEQLIPLIFTLTNIQSNKQQVTALFKSLQVETITSNDIRREIENISRDQNGFLPLSEITNILKINRLLLQGIEKIRIEIIQKVIKDEFYLVIKRRIFYYNTYPPEDFGKPKEPCVTYLTRRLFSFRPPSLYYDYKPLNKQVHLDEILFVIRKRYGYSSRPDRYSSVSMTNSRHNSTATNSHILRSRASTSVLNGNTKISIVKADKNHSLSTNIIMNPKTPVKSKSIFNESTDYTHGKYNHVSVKIVPIDNYDNV